MKREINNIDRKTATPKGDVRVKILKWNSDIIAPVLKETQTFKAYYTESYKCCFIIAVSNTKILKTYSLLKKI